MHNFKGAREHRPFSGPQKYVHKVMVNCLVKLAQEKNVVR